MTLKRYKPGETLAELSAADENLRADMIERTSSALGVMPKPGIAGMFGFLGAFGAPSSGSPVMWGKLTDRTTGSAGLSSAVQYKAESLDGSIRITTFEAPLFRVFHDSTRIVPAPADSECLIGWYPDPATDEWVGRLLWVRETNDPGACE